MSIFKKDKETLLSEDSAKAQLDLLVDFYDIEVNDLPQDQREAVNGSLQRVTRAIRSGMLEIKKIDDSIVIEQHLQSGQKLEYALDRLGKAKTAMKGFDLKDYYGRIYAMMGSLSGIGSDGILQLKGKHLSVVESLGVIFLQV